MTKPLLAQAQPPTGAELDALNPTRFSTIGEIFGGNFGIINIFITISGFALVIYIILGGFSLMTSGGDPKKIQSGKSKITNGVLGFIVVVLAYAIVRGVGLVLQLPDFENIF